MAVLAGPRPEVCFAKYGGVNIPNAPFTHELALRILLHSLQTIASRYRRSIEPVLSCSIDYYVRVFIRVFDSPIQTKKAARYLTLTSKTSMVYFCPKCKSFELVPIGKYFESEKGAKYGPASVHVSSVCTNCQGKYQIGGPFYSAPLHSPEFLTRMIGHIGQSQTLYGTWTRMAGMLQVISEEIDEPLYYILSKLCSTIHCSSPKLPVFM